MQILTKKKANLMIRLKSQMKTNKNRQEKIEVLATINLKKKIEKRKNIKKIKKDMITVAVLPDLIDLEAGL